MPSLDDTAGTLNAGRASLTETAAVVGSAKAQADAVADHMRALGAEGSTIAVTTIAEQLEEVRTALQGLSEQLNEIHAAAHAAKEGAPVLSSGPAPARPPPAFIPAPGYPAHKTHAMSWSDLNHVVHGDPDNRRSGGHLHGTGRPGKTEFPPHWDEQEIHEALKTVADRPRTTRLTDSGNWFADGDYREVQVTSVVRHDGSIAAGWPISGPGVKRNPR